MIVNFDDNWLLEKMKAIAKENGNSLHSSLATQFLTRDPIRCVCECLAFTDVREPGQRVLPAYTSLSNLSEESAKKEMTRSFNVPEEEIWIDKPFEDLPFENRYRPFSYRGGSEKGIIRVLASPDEEPTDIAEFPSSLASFLARNMAQIVRIYTTKRHRINLRDNLKKRYGHFKEIMWLPSP